MILSKHIYFSSPLISCRWEGRSEGNDGGGGGGGGGGREGREGRLEGKVTGREALEGREKVPKLIKFSVKILKDHLRAKLS